MTLYVALYATRDHNHIQIRTAVPWSLYQEDTPDLLYTEDQARALARQIPPGAEYEFQTLRDASRLVAGLRRPGYVRLHAVRLGPEGQAVDMAARLR